MRSRSAFFSAPAVAGLALLAIVLGAVFGVRSTLNREPETQVAGTVIERETPTEAPTEPAEDDDPIVIPLPPADDNDEDAAVEDPVVIVPAPADEPAPAPAPQPTVGLIRVSPAPAPADDDAPSRPRPSRTETEQPRPRPTRTPTETTSPAPANPTPSPTPSDVALQTGEGHSRDTAIADNGDWLFREVQGHGGPGQAGSREAQARLTVGFNDEAKFGQGPVRPFQCRAWLTAGEGRLTTDTDHFFEIALLAVDENGDVIETVTSVMERHAYDLAAGESTAAAPMTTTPLELDAADGISYTCGVRYRAR